MADNTDNPLEGFQNLGLDELREELESTDYTIEQLDEHFESHREEYDAEAVHVFRNKEQEGESRKGALAVLQSELDEKSVSSDQIADDVDLHVPDGMVGGNVESESESEADDSTDDRSLGEAVTAENDNEGRAENVGPDTDAESNNRTVNEAADDADETATAGLGTVDEDGADAQGGEFELPFPQAENAPAHLTVYLPYSGHFAGILFDAPGHHQVPYQTPNDEGVPPMRVKRALERESNPARLSRRDPLHPDHEEEQSNVSGDIVG